MKLTIRFKHGMAPYQAGETATFDAEYARKVINGGYAEIVKQETGGVEDGPAGEFLLEGYSMAELRSMAKKAGIKFDARTKKVDLISMLRGEK